MPDTISLEMDLTAPVESDPAFESAVERFVSTALATSSSIFEWQAWNWGKGINKSRQGKIWNRRGYFFDRLGGNNLDKIKKNYKGVDYLKGAVVGQIKSLDSTNKRTIEKAVSEAYKKMFAAIKSDVRLVSARSAELKIIVPTGTNNKVIQIIEATGKKFAGIKGGINVSAPKIIRGVPGSVGTVIRGFGVAGGALSAYQLYHDIQAGDTASAIGSGTSSAAVVLEIAAGAVGSTALAVSAAVVGAFALGYGVGTLINNHVLSDDDQYLLGGVLTEMADHGWVNIKDFYTKQLFQ